MRRTDVGNRGLFNENVIRKLNYYAARDEGLSQWIADPSAVLRGTWGKALEIPSFALFLLSVLRLGLWRVSDPGSVRVFVRRPESFCDKSLLL
jgi:hypothetical protein